MASENTETLPDIGGYELAEQMTGIGRSSLYAMVHHRRIPHLRLGRRLVRFRRAELEAWLDSQAVPMGGEQS